MELLKRHYLTLKALIPPYDIPHLLGSRNGKVTSKIGSYYPPYFLAPSPS